MTTLDLRVIGDDERYALDRFKESWAGERPPVVFDVGANVGAYTHELLLRLPDASVFCFEPQVGAHLALMDRHEAALNVEVRPHGLGVATRVATLRKTDQEACVLATLHDHEADVPLDAEEDCVLHALDRIATLEGVQHIDWLKIDTEGHELDVLRGASAMLVTGSVDVIQFEYDRRYPHKFLDLWLALRERYTLFRMLPTRLARMRWWTPAFERNHDEPRNYLAVRYDQRWFRP